MNVSGIVGTLGFLALVVIAVMAGGDSSLVFVNYPAIVFLLGATYALGLVAFGYAPLFHAYRTLCKVIMWEKPAGVLLHDARVLRGQAKQVYAAGLVYLAIGVLNILLFLEEPADLGVAVMMAMFSLFYALVLAEGFLRPCAWRIEFLLGDSGDKGR